MDEQGNVQDISANGNVDLEEDEARQDGKKRPLSVVSSSSASTASLQRHQHKKMAGAGALGAPPWMVKIPSPDTSSGHEGGKIPSGASSPSSGTTSPQKLPSGATPPYRLQNCKYSHNDAISPGGASVHNQDDHTGVSSSVASSLSPSPYSSPCHQGSPVRSRNDVDLCSLASSSGPCSPAHAGYLGTCTSTEDQESGSSSSRPQSTASIDQEMDDTGPKSQSSTLERMMQGPGDLCGMAYVEKVVAEIIETEKTYVKDLQEIIEGYVAFTKDSIEELGITQAGMEALFGNIEEVFEFNREFLKKLLETNNDVVDVAKCFVSQEEGFKVYIYYCTNYPRSVEVLTECMRDSELAELFRQQQFNLEHNLPLGSYLLKPVQRILKYHLMLQKIVKQYDGDLYSANIIQAALSSMTGIADHINEMKRRHEHAVRVQEIQSLLIGWEGPDLTTFGDLVLEDTFRMYGAKAYRQLFLFDKGLFIAKRKEDQTYAIKANIMCSNLMLIESIPKEPLSFHVIPFDNPRMQYTVQAKNLEQKRHWCMHLKRLILENYNAVIPEKAKELVMMLGKSREEQAFEAAPSGENVEQQIKKQHSAPEYLEKRKTRRRSTSIIPDFGLLKTQRSKRNLRRSPPTQRKAAINEDVTEEEDIPEESEQGATCDNQTDRDAPEAGNVKSKIQRFSVGIGPSSDEMVEQSQEAKSPSKKKGAFFNLGKSKPFTKEIGGAKSRIFGARGIKTRGGSFNEGKMDVITNEHTDSCDSLDGGKERRKYPVMRRSRTETKGVGSQFADRLGDQGKTSSDPSVCNRLTGVYDNLLFHPKWNKVAMANGNDTASTNSQAVLSNGVNLAGATMTESSTDLDPWITRGKGHAHKFTRCAYNELPVKTFARSHSFTEKSPTKDNPEFVKSHKRRTSDSMCYINKQALSPEGMIKAAPAFDNQERLAIIRYCTPPREIVDESGETSPAKFENQRLPMYSPGSDAATVIANIYYQNPYLRRFVQHRNSGRSIQCSRSSPVHRYMSKPRGATSQGSSPQIITPDSANRNSGLSWKDFENFVQSSPTLAPRFPVGSSPYNSGCTDLYAHLSESVVASPSSPCSTLDGSVDTPCQSPDVASPMSVASNDSIMDSLKHAVLNLTTRITGKSSRSVESSPSRTRHLRRPRSVGELEEFHVQADSKLKGQKHRAISKDRTKKSARSDRKPPSGRDKETKSMAKQLASLLRDNKQGSSNLGARLATSSDKPVVIGGNYTLTRQRPARPKKQRDSDNCDSLPSSLQSSRETTPDRYVSSPCVELDVTPTSDVYKTINTDSYCENDERRMSESKNPTHDSGCLDAVLKDVNLDDPAEFAQLQYQGIDRNKLSVAADDLSNADSSEENPMNTSTDSYYERMLAEDLKTLESGLEKLEGECRDSAIYSDDGATGGDPDYSSLRMSIQQTVKVIEDKYKQGHSSKSPTRKIETGREIKNIVKHLEQSMKLEKTISPDSKACNIKSVRERTRELVECATLTRIRQESVSIGEESPDEADGLSHSPARKGLVKELVSHFQQNADS